MVCVAKGVGDRAFLLDCDACEFAAFRGYRDDGRWLAPSPCHSFVRRRLSRARFRSAPCRTRPKVCASAELANRRRRARRVIVCFYFIPVSGALSGFGRTSDASADLIFGCEYRNCHGRPQDERIRRYSGSEPYPRAVPALHVSEFVNLIRWTHVQEDFGPFLDEVLRHVPFAFVGAGRMDGSNYTNIYIVPPDVPSRKNVWAWRFTTCSWPPGQKPWSILQDVVEAEPLP